MSKGRHKRSAQTSVADQLRSLIQASEESVSAIARATDIPQPVLHRFVAGERDLTLRTADKLIRYFGLELRPARTRRRT